MPSADPHPVRRALLSAADKTGLVPFAQFLAGQGAELVSTGGTAAALAAAGLAVTPVEAVTGFPEILDGRVKTLHPAIHVGLLARQDLAAHRATLAEHGIPAFDLLAVTLYRFEAALAAGADRAALLEEVDVGGPAMLRAAAKNHASVAVLSDPAQYAPLQAEILATGGTSSASRARLAAAAFARTAGYDAAIAGWLAGEALPEQLLVAGTRVQMLRYGENPHQAAAVYAVPGSGPNLAGALPLQGKPLSYNNFLDADAALAVVHRLSEPAAVIVKHATPCGVALGADAAAAFGRAQAADPVSAFGGIVAFNRPLDAAAAGLLAATFLEVVIAPAVTPEALTVLATKPGLRVLALALGGTRSGRPRLRSIAGGFLAQAADDGPDEPATWRSVGRRAASPAELADLALAWTVARQVASNAIVLVADGITVGIGGGQTSRVAAVEQALRYLRPHGTCVLASDGFFPFPDGVEAAVAGGVTAIVQPGGSRRDDAVIAVSDAAGCAMLLTDRRHFRH